MPDAVHVSAPPGSVEGEARAHRAGGSAAGVVAAVCYLAAVAGANWASTWHMLTLGAVVVPAGACMAGLVFTARDFVHDALGAVGVVAAIAAGTVLSVVVASPRIALVSAAVFLISELADSWLYRRLRSRGRPVAIAGSNLGGLVADSALFVPCAFGSLVLLPGQLAGKTLTTAAAVAVTAAVVARRREVRP